MAITTTKKEKHEPIDFQTFCNKLMEYNVNGGGTRRGGIQYNAQQNKIEQNDINK